jgi:peptide/nickel transport system permease protein
MEQVGTSLNQKAWKRFKRNRAAMFGLVIVVLSFLIAVFAYQLAPDNTPDANDQVLELEMRPPGFHITLLKLSKALSAQTSHRSVIDKLFGGIPAQYETVPITGYKMKKDFTYVSVYRGESMPTEGKKYDYTTILKSEAELSIKPPAYQIKSNLSDSVIATKYWQKLHDLVYKRHLMSRTYWLGTDRFGRDILSRLIIGTRVSLFVGLVAVLISLLIGVTAGAVAGYYRGWVDELVMWVVNVFWSIPTLLLAMGLYVGLTMWVEVARIVRGQFIQMREMEYVTAAQSLGYSASRTIFLHILPNILGPVIVVACANFANAILIESGLSYIGLGVQPPTPSWGGMLSEYKDFIDSGKAFLALAPGVAIMLLVLAFNLVGNGLRDALDVRGKQE